MGMFSDVYDEFKSGSPREKLLIVGGVVVVGGVAFYMYKKNAASGVTPSAASGLNGLPSGFQQGAPGGAPGAPVPTQGTTPVPPTPRPTPTPTPTPTKPPTPFIPVPNVPTLPARQSTTVASVKASQPTSAPKIYFQNQPVGYTYNPQSTYEVARGHATYGTPPSAAPPPPKPVVVVTPAQTYLQVGTRKMY